MDDAEARLRLTEARKLLDKAMVHAASAGQKVEIISTIDQNVASGIRRIAVEVDASDIVLGHSEKTNLFQMVFGKTNQNIIDLSTQAVWVCRMTQALNMHRTIRLFCPAFCEMEFGFGQWVEKIARLSGVLSRKTICYSSEASFQHLSGYVGTHRLGGVFEHQLFQDWDWFSEQAAGFESSDLVVVVSPREGHLSHAPVLDKIGQHLDQYLKENSFIVIYPRIDGDSVDDSMRQMYI